MELYHAEIGLPQGFRMPTDRVSLVWTRHADRARVDDRYCEIPRFATIPLASFTPIEVGVEAGRVAKLVVRGHYTSELDVVFVLIPNGSKPWLVKTVWVNKRSDVHRTLDRSKYRSV